MPIFDATMEILQKSMDLRMVNNRVISSNIANVDTPGYQAQKLNFAASIQAEIDKINAGELTPTSTEDLNAIARNILGIEDGVESIIEPTGSTPISLDGNNVDMEQELGALGENSMLYELTARLLSAKMRQIRTVLDNVG